MTKNNTDIQHGTLRTYVSGFAFSIILTLSAYIMVVNRKFSRNIIIGSIVGLALIQFLIQLVFFLHLGKETKPRWKLFVFIFMILIVCILVFGSIWIMNNLSYRMTPEQIKTYIHNQGGGF